MMITLFHASIQAMPMATTTSPFKASTTGSPPRYRRIILNRTLPHTTPQSNVFEQTLRDIWQAVKKLARIMADGISSDTRLYGADDALP